MLSGLDDFATAAGQAYAVLETIINDLPKSSTSKQSLKKDLEAAKLYLKTKYYSDCGEQSHCITHCTTYGLSQKGSKDYASTKDHKHDQKCQDCTKLAQLFDDIAVSIDSVNDREAKGELLYDFKCSRDAIIEQMRHLNRSAQQNLTQRRDIKNMDKKTSYAVVDWMQKELLCEYRDFTEKYYGKRGMSGLVNSFTVKETNKQGALHMAAGFHSNTGDNKKLSTYHQAKLQLYDRVQQQQLPQTTTQSMLSRNSPTKAADSPSSSTTCMKSPVHMQYFKEKETEAAADTEKTTSIARCRSRKRTFRTASDVFSGDENEGQQDNLPKKVRSVEALRPRPSRYVTSVFDNEMDTQNEDATSPPPSVAQDSAIGISLRTTRQTTAAGTNYPVTTISNSQMFEEEEDETDEEDERAVQRANEIVKTRRKLLSEPPKSKRNQSWNRAGRPAGQRPARAGADLV
ncbi:unnamed protein product [Didymodactylos carnosus]|uniref:Uncharacterized protein n=1 Tax=Didymodactylos carnosus TaxID=1234261 RepID=A0A815EN72_9BILA|nr:unnamed protein product [Didymodactylos carnosus]CAF4160738.1 unnamed protein product [Didymodactylos carnosus]